METNCKQGDLAIVVWSGHPNHGMVVKCARKVLPDEVVAIDHMKCAPAKDCVMWEVDRPMRVQVRDAAMGLIWAPGHYCDDAHLRRLRTTCGIDETRYWVAGLQPPWLKNRKTRLEDFSQLKEEIKKMITPDDRGG